VCVLYTYGSICLSEGVPERDISVPIGGWERKICASNPTSHAYMDDSVMNHRPEAREKVTLHESIRARCSGKGLGLG
jgi:hypothetical protein